jgi:hypothetical protein
MKEGCAAYPIHVIVRKDTDDLFLLYSLNDPFAGILDAFHGAGVFELSKIGRKKIQDFGRINHPSAPNEGPEGGGKP